MIKEIDLVDAKSFYDLGLQVDCKFLSRYIIDDIFKDQNQFIYGYYERNKLIGFIHGIKSFEQIDIVNIVVDKKSRCQGVGTTLITYLVKKYDDLEAINLEVKVNNLAVKFYLDNGFEIIRELNRYYEDCDGYFMKKVIK
jgi:ribosomal protein S18 acetylase RimI-like enzyme